MCCYIGSAKCQQYKHSSKSSWTSSKDLSMKISKDIKRLQGYGQYTRNVNIEVNIRNCYLRF